MKTTFTFPTPLMPSPAGQQRKGGAEIITRTIRDLSGKLLIAAFAIVAPGAADAAPPLTTLYNFTGGSDGAQPVAGLVFDRAGALYGVANSGGDASCNCGTVFKLTPPSVPGGAWVESTLHIFNGSDGANPRGTPIIDNTGALYGTTAFGGPSPSGTRGSVFKLTPPSSPDGIWSESIIYDFLLGARPFAGVIMDSSGRFYGTTSSYELLSSAFELSPPSAAGAAWTHNLIFFNDYQGAGVQAGLIFDSEGALYGTDTEDVDASEGAKVPCFPATTGLGCGSVFKLSPPSITGTSWIEDTLYNFHGSDGIAPFAGLVMDQLGALYGTTAYGGNTGCTVTVLGCGTVFKLTPPSLPGGNWTETTLHNFSGSDGANPYAGLIFDSAGALYGTTAAGGAYGDGTVFKLIPPKQTGGPWTEIALYNFSGSDGANPRAGLIFDNMGALYGTTAAGNAYGAGTVFKLATFAGSPGRPNCIDQSISALARKYGGLAHAAAALDYSSVTDLQNAIAGYCGG